VSYLEETNIFGISQRGWVPTYLVTFMVQSRYLEAFPDPRSALREEVRG